MPVLKNTKYEAFAQGLAAGKSQDAAYADAGFKAHRQNASRLMTKDDVRRRVEEIKARVSEKAEWSAAERLASLKAIHDASLAEDRRTAIAAIAEANRMNGSYAPSKSEVTGRGGGPIKIADLSRLKGMTTEELKTLDRALVQIGIAEGDTEGTGEQEE